MGDEEKQHPKHLQKQQFREELGLFFLSPFQQLKEVN
jgi:hypothetical protein